MLITSDAVTFSEGIEECIANSLWHECGGYLECKDNNLEGAASLIVERLKRFGYVIREK
jgi:hypothetical protein